MTPTAGRARRIVLLTVMAALIAGAGAAIVAVVADVGDPLATRLLGTAGFAAVAALTGLCAALLLGRGIVSAVGVLGIVVSMGTLVLAVAYVWGLVDPGGPEGVRPLGAAVAGSLALAWVSLLLLLLGRSASITAAVLVAITAVAALAGLLVAVMFMDDPSPPFARAIAVAAIVAILGSFLAPILAMVRRSASTAWHGS